MMTEIKPEPLDLEELKKIIPDDECNVHLRDNHWIPEIKQHIKSACEFCLRYKDNPELLVKEYPEYKEDVKKIEWIPNPDFERCRKDEFIEEGKCDSCPVKAECKEGEFIGNIDFIKDFNEWLFKLAFRGVWNEERLR